MRNRVERLSLQQQPQHQHQPKWVTQNMEHRTLSKTSDLYICNTRSHALTHFSLAHALTNDDGISMFCGKSSNFHQSLLKVRNKTVEECHYIYPFIVKQIWFDGSPSQYVLLTVSSEKLVNVLCSIDCWIHFKLSFFATQNGPAHLFCIGCNVYIWIHICFGVALQKSSDMFDFYFIFKWLIFAWIGSKKFYKLSQFTF